jgi:hypothetical protein
MSGETPIPIAARARSMTAEQWVESAIDQAYAYHVNGTLHFEGVLDNTLVYTCPSSSRSWVYHTVTLCAEPPFDASCSCAHGVRRLPCPHAGAGILLLEQMQKGLLPQNLRGQMRYEFWMDTLDAS